MDPASNSLLPPGDAFNRTHERALINIVSGNIQRSLLEAHQKRPELFGISEEELKEKISAGERGLGGTMNSLRMKFWIEYDEAQNSRRDMKTENLYAGICTQDTFYKVMKSPEKVAWLLCKPVYYDAAMVAMHQFAISEMREILEAPISVGGKDRPAIIAAKIKLFELIELRIKGAVVQKTMNVHSTVPSGKAPLPASDKSRHEELDRRLKELEQQRDEQAGKIINVPVVTTE